MQLHKSESPHNPDSDRVCSMRSIGGAQVCTPKILFGKGRDYKRVCERALYLSKVQKMHEKGMDRPIQVMRCFRDKRSALFMIDEIGSIEFGGINVATICPIVVIDHLHDSMLE